MDKRFEKINEIAESEGWEVSHTVFQGEISFEFSKLSPAGQDFCFTRDVDYEDDEDYVLSELRDAVYRYWENFDVCEETYIWLDNTGHGMNGAPEDMKDLYEDMQACEDMIHDLWLALEGRKKPTEEKPKQYVYGVFESDAWHSYDSQRLKGYYLSLEDAVDAIMEHGDFDEDDHDPENIREFLMRYRQTPNTGDVNYDISAMEVGSWNE